MMLGIEFGWIFSCSGRQPWTIYGMQRTVDASTRADFVGLICFVHHFVYWTRYFNSHCSTDIL